MYFFRIGTQPTASRLELYQQAQADGAPAAYFRQYLMFLLKNNISSINEKSVKPMNKIMLIVDYVIDNAYVFISIKRQR